MMRAPSVWIGFDPRPAELAGFAVTRSSLRRHATAPIPTHAVMLSELRAAGLYKRPTEHVDGRMIDVLSKRSDYDGACSTEFAISRFLVPHLAGSGWALFCDCDMLFRGNVARLFEQLNPNYAAYCVKHDYRPSETSKMDGQVQSRYPRKNWTSLIVFNCDHPANRALTLDFVNSAAGRDLHALMWLADADIGTLDIEWNWLVGHSPDDVDPHVVHFTSGLPCMPGYENVPYADEWRNELSRWAA